MGSGIERLRPEEIPSGTRIDLELIRGFFPQGARVLDLGCGRGDYWSEWLGWVGEVVGVDVNQAAIGEVGQRPGRFWGLKGDVTRLESLLGYPYWLSQVERFEGVTAKGLFPSILEEEGWRKVLRTADVFLRPRSRLIISDVVRADQWESYKELVARGLVTMEESWAVMRRWQQRLRMNRLAFPELPSGSFIVARPGPAKWLEWEESLRLRWLRQSSEFERFARHLPLGEFENFLVEELGYRLVEKQPQVLRSRGGGWYPGMVWVWQKPDGWRFRRWESGRSGLLDLPGLLERWDRLAYALEERGLEVGYLIELMRRYELVLERLRYC